jgi:hypothetical protein
MIPGFTLPRPDHAPRSAEEAVQIAQTLLRQAELEGASASLLQPATHPDGFTGARVELVIPEKALEGALRKAVEQKAREEGAQIKQVQLTLTPVHERSIRLQAQVSASMLLSTVSVSVGGEIAALQAQTLCIRDLRADCGRGMFATMASAFLAPKIREWEGKQIDLRPFTQRDMTIECLEILSEGGHRKVRVLLCA